MLGQKVIKTSFLLFIFAFNMDQLQKTGSFARNWPLSKGGQLNSQKHGQGCGLANAKKK